MTVPNATQTQDPEVAQQQLDALVAEPPGDYELRISPTTVDKLGVKLYDKVSAVVAELVANGYDADATRVEVSLPLSRALASKDRDTGQINEPVPPWVIEVIDNGHGMTPGESRRHFSGVGRDRRRHGGQGALSRERNRHVMGRKGIGKLAPFGVCRRLEVISSGGPRTGQGYYTTHFFIDYDRILAAGEAADAGAHPVPLDPGPQDGAYQVERGTTIRLTRFLNRRVPDQETFKRQLERRFALADDEIDVHVIDAAAEPDQPVGFDVDAFDVPIVESTRIDLSTRPVVLVDGREMPVQGHVGMATEAYQNDEMAGVRIYARGKIIATTRDFEQPSGYTGEFTARSYLVGEVHADWLDDDDGEDLVRTDRQDILWSSELGEALRMWGGELIKQVGASTRKPRRERTQAKFLQQSNIEAIARERYPGQEQIVRTAVTLAGQIGQFAAPDELEDKDYVLGLREVVLQVAPHRALMEAFQDFSSVTVGGDVRLETLADLFGKTNVAEMASYGQIAHERIRAITELQQAAIGPAAGKEDRLQEILAKAPYLIEPTWSAVTKNQSLKTFKDLFELEWLSQNGESVELTIDWDNKRPDFVLADVGSRLNIVEIKAPGHVFADDDYDRMARYVRAFRAFATRHTDVMAQFRLGWRIMLVCDAVKIRDLDKAESFNSFVGLDEVTTTTWGDFTGRARRAHEQFLEARDEARRRA
ncbi:MAG: ATP-binding protein [Solirubrobacteraceae bacterium]